jgi:anthranilate/para-aminobenzoate synthase component I
MSEVVELHKTLEADWRLKGGIRVFCERKQNQSLEIHFFCGIAKQSICSQWGEVDHCLQQSLALGSPLSFLLPFNTTGLSQHSPGVLVEPVLCVKMTCENDFRVDLNIQDLQAELRILKHDLAVSEIQSDHSYRSIQNIQTLQNKGDCYLINFAELIFEKTAIKTQLLSKLGLVSFLLSNQRFGGFVTSADQNLGVCLSSPEKFISISETYEIATQPIKGTRATGSLDFDIHTSEKEMREHLMVIDLLRNDLNKICFAGSVRVIEPYDIFEQNGLLQMKSTVTGKLREPFSISSLMPPGSVSGTPKKQCLEILREHETHERGYFTGCTGYIFDKKINSAINIRSLFWDRRGTYVGAGAGITTLSNAAAETAEINLKFARIKDHFELRLPLKTKTVQNANEK